MDGRCSNCTQRTNFRTLPSLVRYLHQMFTFNGVQTPVDDDVAPLFRGFTIGGRRLGHNIVRARCKCKAQTKRARLLAHRFCDRQWTDKDRRAHRTQVYAPLTRCRALGHVAQPNAVTCASRCARTPSTGSIVARST